MSAVLQPIPTQPPATVSPYRVVVYTDSTAMGGAEISLGNLVATVSNQVDLMVVGVSPDIVQAIVKHRPHTTHRVLPARGLAAFFAHLWTFKQLNPDVIHLNLCVPWAGKIALLAALLLPDTRVVRVDQLPLRTTDALALWLTRLLTLRVDAHVAVGETSARRVEDFYALGRNSILSVPNGVPVHACGSPPSSQPGTLKIASIGRLDAMKGHDLLIRAIAQVEGIQAVIIGEGRERSALEQLIARLGVGDRVTLPGWADQTQEYLEKVDAVVLPSRSEGFPLAMVEAMLAGRSVIATRVGSMPEAILDGKTGLLIEKNDVAGLANALRHLRDNPADRLRLGTAAREMALAHFTVDSMTQQYESLWQRLLMRPKAPRLRVPRPKD